MNKNYNPITFFKNTFILIDKFLVANFAIIIKIEIIIIKTTFKYSKNIKELEIMYQNAMYIFIS